MLEYGLYLAEDVCAFVLAQRLYGAGVNALAVVGNNLPFVGTVYGAQAATGWAGALRRVERKSVRSRLRIAETCFGIHQQLTVMVDFHGVGIHHYHLFLTLPQRLFNT